MFALLALGLAASPAQGAAATSAVPTGTGQTGSGPLVFRATGTFRTAHRDGHWWLVTPDGHPFYSTGIDHVSSSPDVDQTTGQCPYCQAIAADYPSVGAWSTATVARLRSWGFNSLGPFTDDGTFASQMPYSVQLSMASGDDWFAPSFVTHADEVAASQVAPLADDPNLIGFYTDSELHWGPDGSDARPVLDDYLALPPGSPGLAVAQQYAGDPNGFVFALATRYFQVTTAAVRLYDRAHLILGVKAEAQEIQPELLKAARPYVDVFSIDDYQLQPGFAQIIDQIWPQYLPVTSDFSNFERFVRKPIMVAEYSFRALGSATPDTVPFVYATYATQQERAAAYTEYVAPLYEDAPWVVGDEWFEYVDEPAGGRFDGENNNFGVVDVEDQPYEALVTQMEILHSTAPDRVAQPGTSCDSWTRGPGGVSCDATMENPVYPPSIAAGPATPGTQGRRYSASVLAIGGRPPYSFAVDPATPLPKGLQLGATTGRLSGIPRESGTFTVTVDITDSTVPTPLSAAGQITVTITPPGGAPIAAPSG